MAGSSDGELRTGRDQQVPFEVNLKWIVFIVLLYLRCFNLRLISLGNRDYG